MYANSNPVNYTDPSGNLTLSRVIVTIIVAEILWQVVNPLTFGGLEIVSDSFDSNNNGSIVAVCSSALSIRFMNSSIQQLAASIITYQNNFLSQEYDGLRLSQFEQELASVDSKALENRGNIWATVIERLAIEQEGY
jgi:hypothetical protein